MERVAGASFDRDLNQLEGIGDMQEMIAPWSPGR